MGLIKFGRSGASKQFPPIFSAPNLLPVVADMREPTRYEIESDPEVRSILDDIEDEFPLMRDDELEDDEDDDPLFEDEDDEDEDDDVFDHLSNRRRMQWDDDEFN